MLENSERAIQNGQSKETGNIGNTRRRKTKHKHNAICVGHYFKQTNTNNLNKTTGGKNEPNIVFKYIVYIFTLFSFLKVIFGVPEFTPSSQWGSCYSVFSCMCMVCKSSFCTFYCWSLYCLSIFDLRILITPLVSSNSSYTLFI